MSNLKDNELSNKLVDSVTKADRSIVTKAFKALAFRNHDKQSLIQIRRNCARLESLTNYLPHHLPKSLVNPRVKPIRPRGFKRLHKPER